MKESFGFENRYNIAAGITAWDDGTGVTEDPSYGQVKIFIKSWGEYSKYDELFHELETRACTADDFEKKGESDTEKYFYKPDAFSARYV